MHARTADQGFLVTKSNDPKEYVSLFLASLICENLYERDSGSLKEWREFPVLVL